MPSAELVLGLRSLYIIPSRFGALWLAAVAMLLLVAIQTASNSTLLLAFLMLGLMLLAMFLTHDSLQGLRLAVADPQPGFAGTAVVYSLRVHSRTPRQRLQFRFQGGAPVMVEALPTGSSVVGLSWTPRQRGWQQPPRLIVDSVAPLGLFICWTRWHPRSGSWSGRPDVQDRSRSPAPPGWVMVLMNGWTFVRIEPAIVSPWWTERRRRRGDRSRSSASESLSNRNGSWRWRRGCRGSGPWSISPIGSGDSTNAAKPMD